MTDNKDLNALKEPEMTDNEDMPEGSESVLPEIDEEYLAQVESSQDEFTDDFNEAETAEVEVPEEISKTISPEPIKDEPEAESPDPIKSEEPQNIRLERTEEGIGVITIDCVGESQNVLNAALIDECSKILAEIELDTSKYIGILIKSAKDNSFIAGADIKMIESLPDEQAVNGLAAQGQIIYNRLSDLPMPVVAMIHGPCLGGGLELALACDYRVCSYDDISKLGFPEVQLGLLPGAGGTQRAPKLIGIQKALDLMLTGRQVRAKSAQRMKLVDEVVPKNNLEKAANAWLAKGKRRPKPVPLLKKLNVKYALDYFLEQTSKGRDILFSQALKRVNAKTRGNYPSPKLIIESVKAGIDKGLTHGLTVEAEHFGWLSQTPQSKALVHLFHTTTSLKKEAYGTDRVTEDKSPNIHKVGVLGGGLMGAGIAFVSVDKAKTPVRIKEVDHDGIGRTILYQNDILKKRVKQRRTTPIEKSMHLSQITGATDWSGFKSAPLIIEAVFEDVNLKTKLFNELDEVVSDTAVLASNTSSIPISEIAENTKLPERVLGMHYFSPVDKMPLLEIIKTDKTADWALKTALDFGRKQGKTVIVVNDGPGFYTTRILASFLNEAMYALAEGADIQRLDDAMMDFGFPVGPFQLMDEVGIDVGQKIIGVMQKHFGERMSPPPAIEKMMQDDRKGKKNGKGFYDYSQKKTKGKRPVDRSVYSVMGVQVASGNQYDTLAERCVLQMMNEAAMCLEENILLSPRDGDIGAVFGLGFPPFLGGPFWYVDQVGPATVVDKLKFYQKSFGERFKPAEVLVKMEEKGDKFFDQTPN